MSSRGGAVRQPHALGRRVAAPRAVEQTVRWLAAHERTSAALLFAGFVLVYLWPVLIGGNVLSPRSVLFQFAPWANSAPTRWEYQTNFILGDVPMSIYPFHVLAREFIHHGTFPAWGQHAYAGVPFFANPQTLILSPFALPIWILPLEFGIGFSAALKLWVAAFGMYLLVRELRLGFWPGVLAGISFALSAFSVVWLTHETLLAVAAILPWMIWLVERIVRSGRLGPAIGLALASVMVMTGGHPGTQVHVMVATGIYALFRAANIPELAHRERARRLALVFGGAIVGTLIVAVLLVPVYKSGAGTIGIQARIGENDTIPGAQLPFGTIRTALFPDWWGRASDLSLVGPGNYNERTLYAGGVATIFALIALVSAGGWRRKAPFALLGFIGLAVPLHAPVFFWLATHLPLLRQVQFQRMMLLYAFGIAVLAAFGLQRVLDSPHERRRTIGVLAAAGAVGLIALGSSAVKAADLGQAARNILHLRHAIGGLPRGWEPNTGGLIATTVGWWLVVVAVVALLLAAWWRWPQRRQRFIVALLLFAALDVLYFAHDYQPMQPAAKVTPPRTPAIAYLQRHAAEGRFAGVDGTMLNDYPAIYGLRDVRGSEPPQPTLRWFHLWTAHVYPEQPDWSQALLPMPDQAGLNVLSVMGARYLTVAPGIRPPESLTRLTVGYRGRDLTVFVNPDAVPRATVARDVVLSANEQGTIDEIGREDFHPREDVVVERGEPGAAALARTSGAGSSARVVRETDATVTLDATLRQPGLVVLDDALAAGWSVHVDGKPARAVRVDDVMRGVGAGPGRHTIVWSYVVPGLYLGLALSLVGLLLLSAACVVLLRTRRHETSAT
jgi:hypothetical protein